MAIELTHSFGLQAQLIQYGKAVHIMRDCTLDGYAEVLVGSDSHALPQGDPGAQGDSGVAYVRSARAEAYLIYPCRLSTVMEVAIHDRTDPDAEDEVQ